MEEIKLFEEKYSPKDEPYTCSNPPRRLVEVGVVHLALASKFTTHKAELICRGIAKSIPYHMAWALSY